MNELFSFSKRCQTAGFAQAIHNIEGFSGKGNELLLALY